MLIVIDIFGEEEDVIITHASPDDENSAAAKKAKQADQVPQVDLQIVPAVTPRK